MKKYHIKDEDGKKYEVEEMDEEVVEEEKVEAHDDDMPAALTDDEIAALKSLAAVADKLVAMANEVHDEDEDEDKEMDDEIEEVHEDEDEEEIVDTDEEEDDRKKAKDSKSTFGKIEGKRQNDSSDDSYQEEVANAWAKRVNGGNK